MTRAPAALLDWAGARECASHFFVWGELQHHLASGYRLPGYNEEEVQRVLGRA